MADHTYPMTASELSNEDGGGFLAVAPDLHGCMADGETAAAAIAELRLAIAEWIDEARRLKRKVPKPGSFAERTRQKNKAIGNLREAQERLIEEQDRLLKGKRKEIEKIGGPISILVKHGLHDERSYLVWSDEGMPANATGAMSRRGLAGAHG